MLQVMMDLKTRLFINKHLIHYNFFKKDTDYVISWKSKKVYNSKLKPLYTAFLYSTKLSEYRIGIKFDKDPLVAEENTYLGQIVNVYIVYDLDA